MIADEFAPSHFVSSWRTEALLCQLNSYPSGKERAAGDDESTRRATPGIGCSNKAYNFSTGSVSTIAFVFASRAVKCR